MLQVDRLREELSGVTDVCGQVFDLLQDSRPDDDVTISLFGLYEHRIVTISRILDDASARDQARPDSYLYPDNRNGSRGGSRGPKRAGSSVVKDRQSLMDYLKK